MSEESQQRFTLNLRARLDACTRESLQKALDVCHGNVSKAAFCLGISRAKIYRLLDRYGFIHDHHWYRGDNASLTDTKAYARGILE